MRLIDADALMENAQVYEIECGNEIGDDVREIKAVLASRIENAPIIDPVKHGKWLINSDGYYPYCSECKAEPKSRELTNYCPNCGAKMDGKDDNE